MEKLEAFTWEVKDNIGILMIDNPPQNQLTNPEFVDTEKFTDLANDKNLRGLVISGNGRHFSSGADKGNLLNNAINKNLMESKISAGVKLLRQIELLNIPVIAAIKGACFGGGLEIALACHIRVSAPNAMFSLPESDLNLIPGMNAALRLPKIIGSNEALKLILSGDIINAETAHKLKLVDYISLHEDAVDYAVNLVKHMTNNKKIEVINSIVRSLNNSKIMSFENAMEEEMKMFCGLAYAEAKRINRQDN